MATQVVAQGEDAWPVIAAPAMARGSRKLVAAQRRHQHRAEVKSVTWSLEKIGSKIARRYRQKMRKKLLGGGRNNEKEYIYH